MHGDISLTGPARSPAMARLTTEEAASSAGIFAVASAQMQRVRTKRA